MTNPTPPNNNGAADAFATREPVDPHDGWEDRLERGKHGDVLARFANAVAIFENHPRYYRRIWQNEMGGVAMIDDRPVNDADLREAREWISSRATFGYELSMDATQHAIQRVAEKRSVHPVRAYLTSLRWDGERRIDSLCARALGNHGELQAVLVRRWLIAAVARAMRPGCKADNMLVLHGKQGAGKSTFFAVLGGAWFTDSLDTGNGIDKDALITAHGYWVCEMAELDGITSKQDFNHLKALVSTAVDTLRRPYGLNPKPMARGFVFCGTTNTGDFIRDESGARRQWIIEVMQPVDVDLVRAEREQLWAEAVAAYRAGEPWWFDAEMTERIDNAQRAFTASDSREERVRQWLLSVSGDVTTRRVLVECLGYEDRGIDRKAETAVGLIMRKLGWDKRRVRRSGDELVYVYERREPESVPTDTQGRNRGGNTIDRSGDAVVPTVPTVPTEVDRNGWNSDPGSSATPSRLPPVLNRGVGTDPAASQFRSENAAKPVPTHPHSPVGTDPTAQPANDDEPSERIEVDRDDFDPSVFVESPDGTIEVVHQGHGRAR